MVSDSNIKVKLKKALIITNIALGMMCGVLLATWLLVLRPTQFDIATKIDQYAYFELDNLPAIANKIDANYYGSYHNNKTSQSYAEEDDEMLLSDEEEYSDIETDDNQLLNTEPEIVDTAESAMPTEILDKAEEIVQKSNKLLVNNNSSKKNADTSLKKVTKYSSGAKIALIVTNLGLNRKTTELALELPKQCGLGFLPYTKSLKPLLHKAQSNGHEIYLYLPLQTSRSYDNPGKYALLGDLPAEENLMRLNIILNSHARYDGVYSSFKEVFTTNSMASEMLFDHLEDKNLMFIMGRVPQGKILPHIDKRNKIIHTSVVLDKEPDEETIKAHLELLIKTARANGSALGYTQGYPLTIEMISQWLPKLRERGVKLVPVSELLK